MASHLTVTSSTLGSARAFGGPAASAAESGDALGAFAALLGASDGSAAATEATTSLSPVLNGGLGTEFGDAETQELLPELDPTAPTLPADPAPVVNLVEALSRLRFSLDTGETLDPELVKDVEAALSDLAEALGLDLETLPVPEDFAALLETGADDKGLSGALTQMLAPLARSLENANGATAASAIIAENAATEQLEGLSDKLAALLSALEGNAVPEEKLAAIGMPPGKPALGEIEEALARFNFGMAEIAVPPEPELAAPSLKLTEPVLTGNGEPTESRSRAVDADTRLEVGERPERATDQPPPRERVAPQRDPSPNPAAAATTVEAAAAEPQAPTTQSGAPRTDSSATSRVVVQSGYQTSQQQLNLPQIAFELGRQIEGGNTRFQIRLDPPELGRIDVRLDIDNSGQVSARLTVEKSETLDLMQRDQRGLERALQQAGIDAGKTNLEFSLKQNPFAGDQGLGDGRGNRPGSGNAAGTGEGADEASEPTPTVNLYRGSLQASGINIIA